MRMPSASDSREPLPVPARLSMPLPHPRALAAGNLLSAPAAMRRWHLGRRGCMDKNKWAKCEA